MPYVLFVVGTAATLWLLVEARGVLQPIMIAVVIWFTLKALARVYSRALGGPRDAPPPGLAKGLSVATMIGVLFGLGSMIAENGRQIRDALPTYEENLDALIARVAGAFGHKTSIGVGEMVQSIDLSSAALGIAGSAASFLSMIIIITFYVLFMFIEDGVAQKKLAALVVDDARRETLEGLLTRINREIELYLGIKVLLGLVQSVPTFLVLWFVGVDGAMFWAMIIFFSSFIPTIGTLVGIAFPALMTLLQFEEIGPFLIVIATLGVVQVMASNLLEPRMMGQSLNLSPLIIFIGIFAGGSVWGIVGALIIVPVLAVTMIICATVPQLRPVAVLLSNNGQID
ncbi:MAG: AI-2E family transporter [Pseudomonadota bacterium]